MQHIKVATQHSFRNIALRPRSIFLAFETWNLLMGLITPFYRHGSCSQRYSLNLQNRDAVMETVRK